jgi:dihydrofolate reductase
VAKLTYSTIASLDGYVEDEQGKFGWAAPDEEVHAFVNELERPLGTYLYGRRMYETMVAWETMDTGPGRPAVIRDYAAIWRAAEKVVYSRGLKDPDSARTRLESEFDPAAVAQLKASAEADIGIGGPGLAAAAFAAGLIDELGLFLVPAIVGGGKPALPDGVSVELELIDERRFGNGTIYLRYRVAA